MPSYLWPMTSPCPVLAGYRLVMSEFCACLLSMCIQNLPATHAFTVVWRLAYTVCHPFLTFYVSYFMISHSPRGWALLDVGLCLLSIYSLTAIISCHITLSFLLWHLFETILLYPFGSAIYSFPSGLVWPLVFYYITCEFLCPIVFSWSSLARLLFLGFLGPFPNSVFPWTFTNFIGIS